MGQLSPILRNVEGGGLTFWCPGCKCRHTIWHGAGPGERWTWNGNVERPTFQPSVLVRTGHYIPEHRGPSCWCTYNAGHPDDPVKFTCYVCHSFVTDGQIQFLSDCTHALAGQTVPLPPIPRNPEI
jgi:hypothetical protein